jgi:hypothetical protein
MGGHACSKMNGGTNLSMIVSADVNAHVESIVVDAGAVASGVSGRSIAEMIG